MMKWLIAAFPRQRVFLLLRTRLACFNHSWLVFAGLFVLLQAGCAHYQPKPISADQAVATFEQRTLSDAGLKAYVERNGHHELASLPLSSWDFPNLTLAAFYFHPDLDLARAKWAVAKGGEISAGERPNPTVSVAPGYNTTTPTPSPWFVTATLDVPIETAGKRGYRIAQANQLSEAARMNIASAAWQVRSRVRRSLLEFHVARETEVLLQKQQATQAEIVRLLLAQFDAGAVSAFEVTQARIALDNSRLALRDAEKQSGEARAQLASSVGLPVSALEGVLLSFAGLTQEPPELPPAEVRRQALLNRADILGALAEYAASEAALRLQIAKQYPDVHFNPGYEFDQGDNKWSLGLSLTLPMLNQNQGAIAEAEARRSEAAAQFIAVQARVIGDVERAVAAYRAALAKTATADALLANSKKQEQTAKAMIEAGEISKLALSATQLELNQNALARLDALVKAQQALGQMEDALQSPVGVSESLWLISPRSHTTTKEMKHE